MAIEDLFVVLIVGVLLAFVVSKLSSPNKPKETHFTCARCGAHSQHTDRTIQAWRKRKDRFFCQSCHRKWIQSKSPQEREQLSSSAGSRGGCLGAVVLITLIPLGSYVLMQAYA